MRVVVGVALIAVSATQAGCETRGGFQADNCDADCLSVADEVFLTNFCTLVNTCCLANGWASSVESCKRRNATGGFSRDPALQALCLSELRGLASVGGAGCLPEIWNLSDACARLVYESNGPLEPGQLCTDKAECAGEAGAITSCLFGRCYRLARGKAGDATCLGDVGDDGLIRVTFESGSPPSPPITTGVVCEKRADLYCAFTDEDAPQTCAPLRAAGAACDESRTCASGECHNGDTVESGLTGTCTPVVSEGQPCSFDDPRVLCDEASTCDTGGKTTGVCVAKLPGGSPCEADTVCATGSCIDARCRMMTDAQLTTLVGYCGFK